MDVLTILTATAFYVLFAVSIWRYLQRRGTLDLAVVLVFTSTAAIFAVSGLNQVMPAIAPYSGPIAVTLLVAQPALMFRLVSLIVPLPRWAVPAAALGFVVAVVGYYLAARSVPAILFLVGYFSCTEIAAAMVLIREARRRRGSPRIRLTTAGVASILFGLSVLVAGLASAARGGVGVNDPSITLLSRLLALVAALGYLAAFVPPRWLREIGHRALAFDVVRTIVSAPTGTEPRVLWEGLTAAASGILGTTRVRIVADGEVVADASTDTSTHLAERTTGRRRSAGPASVQVPLANEGRTVATLEADLDGRPLFLEDDVALIELLGSLTARAVERERAIAILTEAARAVEETAAARASEARFRALLDAEPNAMLSVDADGVIRWCTRSATTLFGVPATGLVGRRLDAVIDATEIGREDLTSQDGVRRYETTGTRADGTSFPAEIADSAFEFEGRPSRLVVISDISWRADADAIRDRFIGVLSHELRTPITSIYGGTQVLLRRGDQLDAATRDQLLADVAGESERLQRMIENLLILARVERGADVVEVVPIPLNRVLPVVIAREHGNWPSMRLTSEIEAGLPLVAGDEASLALVLRNLISNAGKYASEDAAVRVTAGRTTDGAVAIRVQDDGPGIAPGEAGSLFDLYFRSTSGRAAPGSGIGLFVCRQLVAAMGGETWAAVRPEGGAEFGFTLPVWLDDSIDEYASSDGNRPTREAPPAVASPATTTSSSSVGVR